MNALIASLRVVLVPLLLALGLSVAAAAGADDNYMRIFNGIQDADAIAKSGKTEQALAKYREMYTALQSFRKEYPEWDPQVFNFRTGYVRQKILSLTEQLNQARMAAAQGSASQAKSGQGGDTQVKVLDAGAEPRTALRLHPAAGDEQNVTMRISTSMGLKMGGAELPVPKTPDFVIGMAITTTAVAENGDIEFAYKFTNLDIPDTKDVPPQVLDAMKASLEGLKGKSGKGTMSNRGEVREVVNDGTASATDPAAQTVTQAEDLFYSMGVIFPEEPLGKGARWEVTRPVKSQGMTIQQTAVSELTSIEDDTAVVNSTFKLSAANQKMAMPAQPGMNMMLDKLTGSGKGTVTCELSRIMPAKSSATMESDLMTSVSAQGQKQQIAMKIDTSVKLESK